MFCRSRPNMVPQLNPFKNMANSIRPQSHHFSTTKGPRSAKNHLSIPHPTRFLNLLTFNLSYFPRTEIDFRIAGPLPVSPNVRAIHTPLGTRLHVSELYILHLTDHLQPVSKMLNPTCLHPLPHFHRSNLKASNRLEVRPFKILPHTDFSKGREESIYFTRFSFSHTISSTTATQPVHFPQIHTAYRLYQRTGGNLPKLIN